MKQTYVLILTLSGGLSLSGCAPMIAGALAVSTPEEIKTSNYTARLSSDSSQSAINSCLKGVLTSYKDDRGRTPYATFTYRDVSNPNQFVVSNNLSSSWSGMRPELLFLVETNERRPSGTDLQLWTHHRLLDSAGYFDKVQNIIRPCFVASLEEPNHSNKPSTKNLLDDAGPLKKLEQLKVIFDRGLITKEDYDKKKKEIIDGL